MLVLVRESLPISLKIPLSLQSGEQLSNIKEHTKQINDIQTSRDMTMFITASKDNTAKVSFSCRFPARISAQGEFCSLGMFREEGEVLNEQPSIENEIFGYFHGTLAVCRLWKVGDFPFWGNIFGIGACRGNIHASEAPDLDLIHEFLLFPS